MAWTDPRTWATNEIITNGMFNQHVRDNMFALQNAFDSGFFTLDYEMSSNELYEFDINLNGNPNKGNAIFFTNWDTYSSQYGIETYFNTDKINSYGYENSYVEPNGGFKIYSLANGISDSSYFGSTGSGPRLQYIYIDNGKLKIAFKNTIAGILTLQCSCYWQVGWGA